MRISTATPFTVSHFGSAGSVDLYTTRLPRRSVGLYYVGIGSYSQGCRFAATAKHTETASLHGQRKLTNRWHWACIVADSDI